MTKNILIIIAIVGALLTALGIDFLRQSMSIEAGIRHNHKGLSYFDAGDYDKAIVEFNKAIKCNYNSAKYVYGNLGLAYRGKKEYDKAIDCFNKEIEFEPEQYSNYINRVFTYFEMGKYDKALADFDKLTSDPDWRVYWVWRGEAYLNTANYDRAIEDFTNVINHPNDRDYYRATYNRGLAYAKKGEREKAIEDLKTVMEYSWQYKLSAEEALQKLGVPDEEIQKAKEVNKSPESGDKNSAAPQAASVGPESKRLESYIEQLVLQNDEKAFVALSGALDELGLPPEAEAYWIILNGIARLTNKDVIPKITDLILKNKDKNLGGDLLFVMKANRTSTVIPLLSSVLEKGYYKMQLECIHQLGAIPTKESLEALFNFLSPLKDDDTKDTTKGHLIKDTIYALRTMTGVDRGNYPEVWLQWWDENKTKNADELIHPDTHLQRKYIGE